jgi:hypothetical protein
MTPSGQVGIIKEVPVHPVTWFKIEFPSGQIATFRPSAFKLNDGSFDEPFRPVIKRSTTGVKKNLIREKTHISDCDFTAGRNVIIKAGELCGESGEVLRSSNGWIQVLTSHGKVAKRTHELEYNAYVFDGMDSRPIRPRTVSDVTSHSYQNSRSPKKRENVNSHSDNTPGPATESHHYVLLKRKFHYTNSSGNFTVGRSIHLSIF